MKSNKVLKDKLITLRVPTNLLSEYKEFCDENSISVSKRIRRYIEMDLEKYRAVKKSRLDKNI